MGTLTIRSLEEPDLAAVVDLLRELEEFARANTALDLANVAKTFSTMKSSPDHYKSLVALVDEKVVGFLSMVYYKSFYHRGGTSLINELVVSAERRGQGIGKALVRMAVKTSVSDGMDEIEVGTERTNFGAIDFYKKAGFEEEFVLLARISHTWL